MEDPRVSDLDDLPLIQPRMGRDHRASSRQGGGSFRNALLSAMRGGGGARGKARSARSRVAVPRPGQSARRVIVKAHVARMSGTGAKAAALHLRYIERDGVEKDGSKGRFYTAEELGPRLAVDIQRAHAREVTQDRLTALDRELERRAQDNEVAIQPGARSGAIDP